MKRPGIIWSTGFILLFIHGACHGKEPIQVDVKNHCRQPIKVAYNFKSLDGQWVTQGWLTLRSGQTKRTRIKTEKRVIYLYAKSRSRTWSGSNRPHSVNRAVSSRHFKYQDKTGPSTTYKQTVDFFRYKVNKKTRILVDHFRCRKSLRSAGYPAAATMSIRIKQGSR